MYLIIVVLIFASALFSGLTLGLLGLDVYELQRKADLGDWRAKKVYPVRKQGNQLLTTLLLGNVAVNSALSIFLGSVVSGIIAGVIATGLIFLFGEIIPQAVISRHALAFGAKTAPLVRLFMIIAYPISAPIAWILDKALGEEMQTIFSKKELVRVIEEHEDSPHSEIDEDEERILKGVLRFSDRKVRDVMTPNTVVHTIPIDMELNSAAIIALEATGFSRFPVYDESPDDIVGIMYLRDLVGKTKGSVRELMHKKVDGIHELDKLDATLNAFIKKRRHMFIVRDEFGGFEGVITIEDILEEIVGREIVDEDDVVVDMRAKARKEAAGGE